MLRRTRAVAGSAARTAGRTAIIAGTATAVAGKVAHGQAAKAQAAAPPPAAAAPAPPAYVPQPISAADENAGDHLIAQIERLASLKTAGVISEDEFAAAKRKLLA